MKLELINNIICHNILEDIFLLYNILIIYKSFISIYLLTLLYNFWIYLLTELYKFRIYLLTMLYKF
jgi:hypothetical protein